MSVPIKTKLYSHLSVVSLLLRSQSSRLFALSSAFLIRFSFLVSSRSAKYFSRKSTKFIVTLSSVAYRQMIKKENVDVYNLTEKDESAKKIVSCSSP